MLVCALGDLVLDVVVRIEGSFAAGDDTPAGTHLEAGGQAANVAAWAAALGTSARLIAKRGNDGAAGLAEGEVAARGVELLGPVVPAAGGIVVSVVDDSGERSMLTDRGPSPQLRADEIDVDWLRGCDVLHLSGYALLGGSIAEAGARAAGAARAQGARISVDLATARGIADFGPDRLLARLEQLQPDVAFAGDRELEVLGREPPATTLVVKHGASGVTVVRDGSRDNHGARPTDVVDPTGAGDALAAGFLVGGIELGLEAAARWVATAGAMP
jgi:sugar/nucleoside kinase (ribokinase family)